MAVNPDDVECGWGSDRPTATLKIYGVVHQTEKAVCVNIGGSDTIWIPKSQLASISEDEAEVAEWWMEQEGWA